MPNTTSHKIHWQCVQSKLGARGFQITIWIYENTEEVICILHKHYYHYYRDCYAFSWVSNNCGCGYMNPFSLRFSFVVICKMEINSISSITCEKFNIKYIKLTELSEKVWWGFFCFLLDVRKYCLMWFYSCSVTLVKLWTVREWVRCQSACNSIS